MSAVWGIRSFGIRAAVGVSGSSAADDRRLLNTTASGSGPVDGPVRLGLLPLDGGPLARRIHQFHVAKHKTLITLLYDSTRLLAQNRTNNKIPTNGGRVPTRKLAQLIRRK